MDVSMGGCVGGRVDAYSNSFVANLAAPASIRIPHVCEKTDFLSFQDPKIERNVWKLCFMYGVNSINMNSWENSRCQPAGGSDILAEFSFSVLHIITIM